MQLASTTYRTVTDETVPTGKRDYRVLIGKKDKADFRAIVTGDGISISLSKVKSEEKATDFAEEVIELCEVAL